MRKAYAAIIFAGVLFSSFFLFSVFHPSSVRADSAATIGSEALISFPSSALWNSAITFQPGNGDVVNLNPPIFSWPYHPDPSNIECANGVPCANYAPKEFIFQISTNSDFASNHLLLNVLTQNNTYNYIGTLPENQTLYWKVGYIEPANTTDPTTWTLAANSWSTTTSQYVWTENRTFTISTNATNWDRSNFASSTYLSAAAVHPHVMFNASTRPGLYAYFHDMEQSHLSSGTAQQQGTAQTWSDLKNTAATYTPITLCNDYSCIDDAITLSRDLDAAMLVWQLTNEAAPSGSYPDPADYTLHNEITSKDPAGSLDALANWFSGPSHTWSMDTDAWSDPSIMLTLGYGYDWLYPLLNSTQKNDILTAIEMFVSHRMGALEWPVNDSSQALNWVADPTTFWVPSYSPDVIGSSHQWADTEAGIVAGLAAYDDTPPDGSAAIRNYFDFITNFLIAKPDMFAGEGSEGVTNEGRGYSGAQWEKYKLVLDTILYQIAFPDQKFGLNPFWQNNADWWSATTPVGFTQGRDPWGDGSSGIAPQLGEYSWPRDLSYLLDDGNLFQQYSAERTLLYGSTPQTEDFDELAVPYYAQNNLDGLNAPASTTEATLSRFFPDDGWYSSCSAPVNTSTSSCFFGSGFIFKAAPNSGLGNGPNTHSNYDALNFQLWSYGVPLTDSGDIGLQLYPKFGDGDYSLLVDGVGPWQTQYVPNEPFYSRIFAHEEGPGYVYVAGDATNAYPTKPNTYAAQEYGNLVSSPIYVDGGLSYVQKVQRHILFVKNKYYVIYDDLQASQPATFSWLYHVPWLYHVKNGVEDDNGYASTTEVDTFAFSPTASTTFTYTAGNVPVYDYVQNMPASEIDVPVIVSMINNPSTVSVIDQNGANVRINPITGQDWTSQGDAYPRPHAIWISNETKSDSFHFMTVVYPVPPGIATSSIVITRVNDYTAQVTDASGTDIISFDAGSAPASTTILVDLSQLTPTSVTDDITGTTLVSEPYTPPPIFQMLTISAPSNGTITSSPSGISCGATCSASFDYGAVVTLTATPSSGYIFSSWSGACSGTSPTCSISLTSDLSVSATFAAVSSGGGSSGGGSISSGGGGGGGGGGGAGISVYALTLSKNGTGLGTVISNPISVICGAICIGSFPEGATVTLTPTPQSGSYIASWTGCDSLSGSACNVTMSSARTITVTFSLGTSANAPVNIAAPAVTATTPTVNSLPLIPGEYAGLTIDSTGSLVTGLQQFLTTEGYLASQYDTGYYGSITAAAVQKYLAAILAPQPQNTAETLIAQTYPYSSSTFTIGTTGATITALQTYLVQQKYLAAQYVTGYYGPITDAAFTQYKNALSAKTGSSMACPAGLICTPTAGSTASSSISLPQFIKPLTVGSTGAEVQNLQRFLNSQGFTVALTGTGSPGNESMYFGPATKRAVMAFQTAHAAEILTPAGLSTATGYFGPGSIKAANAILGY